MLRGAQPNTPPAPRRQKLHLPDPPPRSDRACKRLSGPLPLHRTVTGPGGREAVRRVYERALTDAGASAVAVIGIHREIWHGFIKDGQKR